MDLPAKDTDPMAYFEQRFEPAFICFPFLTILKTFFIVIFVDLRIIKTNLALRKIL